MNTVLIQWIGSRSTRVLKSKTVTQRQARNYYSNSIVMGDVRLAFIGMLGNKQVVMRYEVPE